MKTNGSMIRRQPHVNNQPAPPPRTVSSDWPSQTPFTRRQTSSASTALVSNWRPADPVWPTKSVSVAREASWTPSGGRMELLLVRILCLEKAKDPETGSYTQLSQDHCESGCALYWGALYIPGNIPSTTSPLCVTRRHQRPARGSTASGSSMRLKSYRCVLTGSAEPRLRLPAVWLSASRLPFSLCFIAQFHPVIHHVERTCSRTHGGTEVYLNPLMASMVLLDHWFKALLICQRIKTSLYECSWEQ